MAALGRQAGNLPSDLTSFVGRSRELAEVVRLLADHRLLTLTGPGGVGKTRLALRVATLRRRAFADGAWLIDLAPLQDPGLLARTVAGALGLRESMVPPGTALVDYLRDKRILLILDNCEHMPAECSTLVDHMLTKTSDLRILVTSRQNLGIRGEFSFPVSPLPTPDASRLPPAKAIPTYDAVKLFRDRAVAATPDFELGADNCAEVARLCQQLDGIPLAIELAAVRLRTLSVEQILSRLQNRYRLLTDGGRNVLPRHRTLQAAMDWSYELCSPGEQELWARMSIFSGTCDLEAVEQVCSGDGIETADVLNLVSGLVDKSILVKIEHGGDARYRMLETIHHYGRLCLDQRGQLQRLRLRHRDYYLRMSERIARGWFGEFQTKWFRWAELEWANLRPALDFCVTEPGQARAGMEIVCALRECWVFGGRMGEARDWLDRILEHDRQHDVMRVTALMVNTHLAVLQGDQAAALARSNECDAEAQRLKSELAFAHSLFALGLVAFFEDDAQRAIPLLEKALESYRSSDSTRPDAFLCLFFMSLAAALDDDDRASSYSRMCRTMAETAGAQWSTMWGIFVSGIDQWRRGETDRADALFRESLSLQRPISDQWGAAWSTETLAWTATATKEYERAAKLMGIAHGLRKMGTVSLPGLRPLARAHERCEALLRLRLGSEAFRDAFDAGDDLSLDQTFAYALGEDEKAQAPDDQSLGRHPPCPLTPRELEVAKLVRSGMTNKEISSTLVISQRTADAHIEHILMKLGYNSRVQIATWITERCDRSSEADT